MSMGERWLREKRAYLAEQQDVDSARPNINDPWGKEWQESVAKEAPFSGDKLEATADSKEGLEQKQEDLRVVAEDLLATVREQMGNVRAGDDGQEVNWRLADGCWESTSGSREERREKCLAEIESVQDFMLLEESRVWLPEGSKAETRLTELFYKTYCVPDSERKSLAEYATKIENNQETQTDENLSDVPSFTGGEEDDAASDSIDTRKNDFVAFARMRLGEDSEEYKLISSEVLSSDLGHFTDADLDKQYQPGDKLDEFRDELTRSESIEERAPLTAYMTRLGGQEVPMRVAASLTTPFYL